MILSPETLRLDVLLRFFSLSDAIEYSRQLDSSKSPEIVLFSKLLELFRHRVFARFLSEIVKDKL